MLDPLQLGMGAIPSEPDTRDWTLAAAGAPTAYPTSAFIEKVKQLTVKNQGKIGSCVGNTFEEIVRLMVWQIALQLDANAQQEELSWRFVYAVAKCLDGFADEGTSPALVAKIIRKYGVPLAIYCPNDVTLDHEAFVYGRKLANIPVEAFQNALNRRGGADFAVTVSEDGIKQAINYARANNGGVAILRQIGDCYWKDANGVSTWAKEKLLPMRKPNVSSGHEEFLYGYDVDPANGRTRIYWLNHWSPQWCSTGGVSNDGGFGWEYLDTWMPYIVEIRVCVAAVPVADDFKYNFTQQMKRGSQGADVVALQHVLKIEQCFPEAQKFTGYYGDITFAGVKELQEKYAAEILTPVGLKFGTGVVAASTLKWLQTHYKITT